MEGRFAGGKDVRSQEAEGVNMVEVVGAGQEAGAKALAGG
jgi:hypothetical protein